MQTLTRKLFKAAATLLLLVLAINTGSYSVARAYDSTAERKSNVMPVTYNYPTPTSDASPSNLADPGNDQKFDELCRIIKTVAVYIEEVTTTIIRWFGWEDQEKKKADEEARKKAEEEAKKKADEEAKKQEEEEKQRKEEEKKNKKNRPVASASPNPAAAFVS